VRRLVLALAVAGLVGSGAGCGDNLSPLCEGVACPDANQSPDGMPDGDITDDFTAFVHDLVFNHTNATEDPAPFASFETLTDNDLDDDTYQAYDDLF
jgi:hypothetical protein